jgi:hypothetical protein
MVGNILLLGKDSGLLTTRAEVLMAAWSVKTVHPRRLAEALVATPFDLAIFCHSMTTADVEAAAKQFRHFNPTSPILWLQEYPQQLDTIGKYEVLISPVHPMYLIGITDRLLSAKRR